MNHVAHCLLSYPDPDLLLGNFIGDFVKGNAWQNYPEPVRAGILMHRKIDSFTDNHPAMRESIRRIRPFAGRFAGPVADILYDHLLILNWESVSAPDFDAFTHWAYRSLDERRDAMPVQMHTRWPRMLAGRFLHGYAHREGMEWVIHRFSERLSGAFEPQRLSDVFFDNIDAFSDDFKVFFPELKRILGL